MKLQNGLYSFGKNDERYTPAYAVTPLLEFLEPYRDKIIWCPFDLEQSKFVTILKESNYKVTHSHINNGQDFYLYEPAKWDIMVSNPPFTAKRYIFERALSFNKPFALLMTNVWLNDAAPKLLFYEKDLQLLMFDKRIDYDEDTKHKNSIPFSSSYYCYNFLPKQIIMRKIAK